MRTIEDESTEKGLILFTTSFFFDGLVGQSAAFEEIPTDHVVEPEGAEEMKKLAKNPNQNTRRVAQLGAILLAAIVSSAPAFAFDPVDGTAANPAPKLNLFSETSRSNWNGVAVSNDGRVFADFPHDEDIGNPGIVELKGADHRTEVPFPNNEWNAYAPGKDPSTHIVSLNAIYINRADNHLWAVDTGAPLQGPALRGGAKLIEFDLKKNQVVKTYIVNSRHFKANSHLNDIRIFGDMVYVTDSGVGAIFTVNRKTGEQHYLLSHSQKTKADPNQKPVIDGQPIVDAEGKVPQVNADGIELSADGQTLYFASAFGPNLYKVATADLNNRKLSEAELDLKIEIARKIPAIGAMELDPKGNFYFSEVETHSIRCVGPDGQTKWVLQDPRLQWADAYSIAKDGTVYFAVSQNGSMPRMHHGVDARKPPYQIFTFKP